MRLEAKAAGLSVGLAGNPEVTHVREADLPASFPDGAFSGAPRWRHMHCDGMIGGWTGFGFRKLLSAVKQSS